MRGWEDYPGVDAEGHTVTGTVRRLPALWSAELENERDILVYLPPSYGRSPGRRYPVLYMQDGQNLFDQATAFADEWGVDESMERAAGSGIEAIVVGIPNAGPARFDEYSPFPHPRHGGGRADDYLRFIVETVKPRVDTDFLTRPDRASTGIMGSSLGALVSLYGFFLHPGTFGFAGAMSPAIWPGGHRLLSFLVSSDPPPGRIYLDVGTREGWGEFRDVRRLRKLLEKKGYRRGDALMYVRARGGRHNEADWGRRFPAAAAFLLGPVSAGGAARERRVG